LAASSLGCRLCGGVTKMAKDKGRMGYMHEGLKKHEPPANDASRAPIGSKHPSVDKDANRSGTAETPPTLGPRTA
jgi:hypothetical protein